MPSLPRDHSVICGRMLSFAICHFTNLSPEAPPFLHLKMHTELTLPLSAGLQGSSIDTRDVISYSSTLST
jgi:hypothetical protein